MPHPAGERLVCDDCGAEIVFVKACPCPDTEPKRHSDKCCGKEMRSLGVQPPTGSAPPRS
jgi:hypothetical protein